MRDVFSFLFMYKFKDCEKIARFLFAYDDKIVLFVTSP